MAPQLNWEALAVVLWSLASFTSLFDFHLFPPIDASHLRFYAPFEPVE